MFVTYQCYLGDITQFSVLGDKQTSNTIAGINLNLRLKVLLAYRLLSCQINYQVNQIFGWLLLKHYNQIHVHRQSKGEQLDMSWITATVAVLV